MIRSHNARENSCFFPESTDAHNHAKKSMYFCLSHRNSLDIHSLIKNIIKIKSSHKTFFKKQSFFPRKFAKKKKSLHLTAEHLQKQIADASSSSSHMVLNLKCVSF